MDLDARKATILKAVVVEHIDTAQPVGSSAVAASADLDVSSATVRSEMVALEREGYLAQPHTSAGRIPTDKGYRYFVDHLQSGVLGAVQQQQVKEFFASVRGEVEEVLEQTSTLLSQMTSYTSVVVGASRPRHDLERAARQPRPAPSPPRHRLLRRFGRQAQSHAELRGDAQRGDGGVASIERARSSTRHSRRGSRCRRVATTRPTSCAKP